MKTILVTGGAGFIGVHLVNRLLKEGHKVVIVDILRSVGGISYVNPGADFLEYDICDKNLYKELDKYTFDSVYHLAAQSAGESAYDDPKFDIMTNSYGTWCIAEYCRKNNIKRLIYTSTVAVYGSSLKSAFSESSPIAPDSIYGVSKYSGELFVKQILGNTDSEYTIFRLFNTYGPGENLNYRKKGMVSIYASYIWKDEPVVVKGSLNRHRDFTYIKDTVEILYRALNNATSYGKTYNLSSGEKYDIKGLLAMMIEVSGKPSDYEIIETKGTPGDSFGTSAVTDALVRDFKWTPAFSLKEGLMEYFKWINSVPVKDDLTGYHPLEMSGNNGGM